MLVNYKKLSAFNDIFVDYINDFNSVSQYYKYDYKNDDNILNIIKHISENYSNEFHYSRQNIANILKEQNELFNSDDKAFENIELLKNENTFAVVTGQQVGLLSGNYYTILKSTNAIQYSEYLNCAFPEYKFIPVFWLECEDHDFPEINHLHIFDKENKLQRLEYFPDDAPQEKYLTPADKIRFKDNIEEFKDRLFGMLSHTEFSDEVKNIVDRSYKSGLSFSVTFARLMNFILKGKGMVFLNPSDKEIKKALKPIFERELNSFPRTCETVIETSAQIEQNYQVQIKPQPINLFYILNDNRYLLENKSENIFSLKNSRQTFSREEISGLLESNPENFSANVVLRPVCQDYLLPTVAYIAGPAEVAYFAQLKKVYENFNVEMPFIFPRASVTLLENRINNFLVKNEISFEEIFDSETLREKIINKMSEVNVEEIISEYVKDLNTAMWTFGGEVRKIDKNLETLVKNKSDKYIESLESIKKKLLDAQEKLYSGSMTKLKSVLENLNPEGTLQERKINYIYYLNKYGMNLTDFLIEEIELKAEGHQVILLNLSGQNENSR
jgi:bacillithiol biosynthesis cysteine-adding enzyme BshC